MLQRNAQINIIIAAGHAGYEVDKRKGDLTKHMRVGFFLNAVPSEFEADHGVGDVFTTEAF